MNDSILKDRWFVDVKGQIRPMTTPQILKALVDGELKVIYRISRDRTNWSAICNEPQFEVVIQNMIKKIAAEVTRYGADKDGQGGTGEQTGFHNLTNIGSSISEQLEHAKNLQEMNVQLQGLRQLASEIISKRKLVIDLSAVKEREELHPDDANEIINAPTVLDRLKANFNWSDPQGRQKIIALVLTIAVAAVFASKYMQRQRDKLTEEAVQQAQAAVRAKALGEYDKAVLLFNGVKDLSNIDPKTLIEMAQAHIETKKYDTSSILLNRVLKDSKNPIDISHAKALLGFIAIRSNNMEAAGAYYEDSLKGDSLHSALYNLAIISLSKNDPQQAETLLLKALEIPDHDKGPMLLALFEAAMQLDRKAQQAKKDNSPPSYPRLDKVNRLLIQATDPLDPYHDENLVTRIIIAATLNRTEDFNALTALWLNLDFRKTITKKYELNVDYDRTTWAHIYEWCVDVYKDPSVGVIKSAFFAGCVARAKSAIEALPYAQYAADRLPDDPNVRGYLGHLVFVTGNIEGAKQVLRAGNTVGSSLAKNSLAEICEKQPDAECNGSPNAEVKPAAGSRAPRPSSNKPKSKKKY